MVGAAPGEALDPSGLDGAGVYQVGWRIVETEHRFSGRLDEGASRHLKLDVQQSNVTDVAFVLRWSETDDAAGVSQPDSFRLAAESPTRVPAAGSPAESSFGVVRVSSGLVNEVPEPLEVEARSLADALDALHRFERDDGAGEWGVVVKLVDAGNPPGTRVDAGNEYELTVTVRHYEPVLTRVVALSPPPALGMVEAARATPTAWLVSAAVLAGAALTLGGFLARDYWLSRRDDE